MWVWGLNTTFNQIHLARTCGVVVKTAAFGAADPSSNPLRGEKFGFLFRAIWRVWSWEVCISCNPMRLGGENYWLLLLVVTYGDYQGLLGGCISCNPVRLGGKRPYSRVSFRTPSGASLVKMGKMRLPLLALPVLHFPVVKCLPGWFAGLIFAGGRLPVYVCLC